MTSLVASSSLFLDGAAGGTDSSFLLFFKIIGIPASVRPRIQAPTPLRCNSGTAEPGAEGIGQPMPRPEEKPDLLIVKHPEGSFLVDPDENEREFSEIWGRSVPAAE